MPRTATAAPTVPLGSLTQPGSRSGTCVACGSERITQLTMTLTDGSLVDFVSCHRCEHRTWAEAGRSRDSLDFTTVLQRTRKER